MKSIFLSLFFLMIFASTLSAQDISSPETFGRTLNLGVGLGYYGYAGHPMPAFHADYEIDVTKNFTLAPFVTYYAYDSYYYWGDQNNTYRNYDYRQTVIPTGVKGTYYFDRLLNAGSHWDFYLAGSLGFAIRINQWEDGYQGENNIQGSSSGPYFDGHIGSEYHLTKRLGLVLDISTGISTFGLAVHL